MDIQASKDGTSLVKGISFFSTWFLHAERYFFLCFFFFFFVLVSFLFIARIEREMRILHTREGLSKGWTDGRVHIC